MDMKPLVSVIVPAYNAEKVLPRSLSSLFNQDYENIEIIVVNDGSKDGTLMYLKSLQAEHKNLVVIDQKNGGVSKARNSGIAVAQGEFIAFLDADDEMPKDFLRKMAEAIGDADMVFGGVKKVRDGKEWVESNPEGEAFAAKEMVRYLFDPPKYGSQSYVWNKLFRREVIEKFNIRFDERFAFCEDWIFVFEYCRHADKVVPIKDNLYLYRLSDCSAMGSIGANPKAMTLIDSFKYLLDESGYPWSKEEKGLVAYMGFHNAYYFVYRHLPKNKMKRAVKQEIKAFECLAKNKRECTITPFIRFKILVHKILFR